MGKGSVPTAGWIHCLHGIIKEGKGFLYGELVMWLKGRFPKVEYSVRVGDVGKGSVPDSRLGTVLFTRNH